MRVLGDRSDTDGDGNLKLLFGVSELSFPGRFNGIFGGVGLTSHMLDTEVIIKAISSVEISI